MKKTIITTILALGMALIGYGQQELQMTQYVFNGLAWNPGYAGSTNYARLALSYRQQFSNTAGAPKMAQFSADIPMQKNNMGLGIQVGNSSMGVSSRTDVYVSYAYQVRFSKTLALGIGIKAGMSNYNTNYDGVLVWDAGDQMFENNRPNMIVPQVGAGLYLHGKQFYLGASVPTIWAYDLYKEDPAQSKPWMRKTYQVSGGYAFQLGALELKPALFGRYKEAEGFRADINCTVGYKNMIYATLGYRTDKSAMAMLEIRPFGGLRIAYAYELIAPSQVLVYGGSTHELLLGYDLMQKKAKFQSNRYF